MPGTYKSCDNGRGKEGGLGKEGGAQETVGESGGLRPHGCENTKWTAALSECLHQAGPRAKGNPLKLSQGPLQVYNMSPVLQMMTVGLQIGSDFSRSHSGAVWR